MTGYEVFHRALALLGYQDGGVGREGETFSGETLIYINQILSDLGLSAISLPGEIIPLNRAQAQALVFGVAMLTAVSLSDRLKAESFEERYQKKRASALFDTSSIRDRLPTPGGE